MRIAIASDDGANVALHTGRCAGFVIYEAAGSAATRLEYRTNSHTAHAQGQCQGEHTHEPGASHHSHGPLVDALSDCTALVTRGLGPRLVADLALRGIDVFMCDDRHADEAAQYCAQGRLPKARPGSGCCCHGH